MDQINPNWGDGTGEGKRITNGKPLKYLAMKKAHELTNGYTIAFFHKYLKQDTRFEDYLTKNQSEEAILFRAE